MRIFAVLIILVLLAGSAVGFYFYNTSQQDQPVFKIKCPLVNAACSNPVVLSFPEGSLGFYLPEETEIISPFDGSVTIGEGFPDKEGRGRATAVTIVSADEGKSVTFYFAGTVLINYQGIVAEGIPIGKTGGPIPLEVLNNVNLVVQFSANKSYVDDPDLYLTE